MSNAPTTTRERALALLGYGSGPEHVAAACGVSVSDISQLISDPIFAAQVAELRYVSQSKHNERDNKLDSLEDMFIAKLESLSDMMIRPVEVLKALQVINAAKRRGSSAPEMLSGNQQVVTLNMPITVIQKFQTNTFNQVTKAGNDDLVTIQSSTLLDAVKNKLKEVNSSGPQRTLPNFAGAGD